MRRFVGLVPVLLLASAVVLGAVIGLRLSHDGSGQGVADDLGCAHVSTSHPQAGVREETCSYHGATLVILTLSEGPHSLYPPEVLDTFVTGPAGTNWVISCSRRRDCVTIQRTLGGDLTSGPIIGLSLDVG